MRGEKTVIFSTYAVRLEDHRNCIRQARNVRHDRYALVIVIFASCTGTQLGVLEVLEVVAPGGVGGTGLTDEEA